MVFSSGITNSAGMPQIGGSAGEFVRPDAGRPYQMWLNALAGYLYYDNGTSWNILKADPINPYTFGTGLTNADYNISVNLSTGVESGNQSIIGGNSNDIINPAYLTLIANIGDAQNSYLNFYSIATGTRYFQDSGNWNFGGLTDTGYLANFAGDVNFEADIYANNIFGANGSLASFTQFEILGTAGQGLLKFAKNTIVPTNGNTILFANNIGRLSFFNSDMSYHGTFDATGITAARTWTLPNATTTLAGLGVANVFTAAQTFPTGSASATSINFGTVGTGLFGNAATVAISGILGIGGVSSTFPGLTKSGTTLQAKLADGSAFCSVSALSFQTTSGDITSNGNIITSTGYFTASSKFKINSSTNNGDILMSNSGGTDFGLLQFGGTSSSFPALKRSAATLLVKDAADSGFTFLQAKLKTDTNYTAGVQVPTGYITIYDAAGTAYKVSCNV